MRLFVAINLGANTKEQLLSLQAKLRQQATGGNFTQAANLHLTLAFLGECSLEQRQEVSAQLQPLSFAPFALEITHLGRFSRPEGALWWAGVEPTPELLALHSAVAASLQRAGFPKEERPYSPHITLGRQVLAEYQPHQVSPFGESCHSFELMESTRLAGKLVYRQLQSIPAQAAKP